MPRAKANGVEIEYDTFGDPAAPALLLVMGLGAQMIAWDEELCERLVERGFFVIRYDNRDIGLSTKFDDGPQPDLTALLSGDGSSAPYLLADMADDAVGLLDALGIARAHIVGASMGGMIVQLSLIHIYPHGEVDDAVGHDAATVEKHDAVAQGDGREPVGHDQGGAALHELSLIHI